MNRNTILLNEIYLNINNGVTYGYDFKNVRYPFFNTVLSVSPDKKYIRWQHYGSSANKNTKKELSWIIKEIFRMTPEEFYNTYIIDQQSEYYWR